MATETESAERTAPASALLVTVITRGSPTQLSGGYLYHRRLAEAAPAHDAVLEFVSASPFRDPLRRARGVPVVDSITAWSVGPWAGRHRGPLAAILHQPPGGLGRGARRTRWQRALDLACYRRCGLLVAASAALAGALEVEHGLDPARILVIEPGCDMPPVAGPVPDLRDGRRVALLCVANWLPSKGVLQLLEALSSLPPDRATLHLAGREDVDAPYGARVRARIAAADLRDRVVAHGPLARQEVAGLYAAADAFVLPSWVEAYGTVYGEALAAGLPVVGWAAGNLPNLVTDGVEGRVLPAGDVLMLTSVLDRLAVDDDWRAALGAAARRRGATLPTWADAAAAFFAAVRALSAGRG